MGPRTSDNWIVDNTLLVVVWAIAAAVTIGATVVALRADRRAAPRRRPRCPAPGAGCCSWPIPAEGLPPDARSLDQLYSASTADPAAPSPRRPSSPPSPPESAEPVARTAVADPEAATRAAIATPVKRRIPVFDLDRLRWWLTDGEVALGRIAVVSVELDNLSTVNERLGY